MSNSPLVTYVHITKNKSTGRGGKKIEKIFVHHMAGNLTVRQCGSVFDSRQASAHYGVNGTAIGQYVDEKDTAWHCGNFSRNQSSIGIELANDGGSKTDWHVSDLTIKTAIKLIADICKRNGIKVLKYTGDMNGNLCMHKWVVSTSCPGPYLSKKFVYIATEVNKILNAKSEPVKLDVDGVGGPQTVMRMQEFLGTLQDGEISGQNKDMAKYYPSLEAVVFDDTESTCVKALQWLVGVYEDGVLGPETVKAWQKFLNVEIDGIFGPTSMKAWQKYLNGHKKAVFPATHVPKPVATPKPSTSTTAKTSTKNAAKIAKQAIAFCGPKDKEKPAYKAAAKDVYGKGNDFNCHRFVGTVLKAVGYPKMPINTWTNILKYLKKNFVQVTGTRKAGDIGVYKNGKSYHIWIELGDGKKAEANSKKKYYPHKASTSSKKHDKDWLFRAK